MSGLAHMSVVEARESSGAAHAPAPGVSAPPDSEEDLVSGCAADPEADLSPATGHMGYSPNFSLFTSFSSSFSLPFSLPFSPVASTQDSCMPLDELANN